MHPTVYLNGRYLDRDAARLHVSDLSLLRGYGVFDYFRYTAGRPRFLDDHLARFERSANLLGLTPPGGRERLRATVHELIDRNGGGDGGIRFVLTGGYSENGYEPAKPNLVGLAYPFQAPPARLYKRGARALTHRYERQLPEAKTIDYIEGIRLLPWLRERGADYVLYVDRNGGVRESDRSNYLIVRGGTLLTPAKDILLGITRKHVLRLAGQLGIPVAERAVALEELRAAEEVIICSSVKGVMPVTSVDDAPVGDGRVGPVTTRLLEAWPAYVAEYA